MSDLTTTNQSIGSQSIVIGKDNISKCVLDYRVLVPFTISKDNEQKWKKNGLKPIKSSVNVHFKGSLSAILFRLTKGAKPVINLSSGVRKDYNKGIVPKTTYTMEFSEKATTGIVSESKALETIADSTKDLSESDRIEYLMDNKLITEEMAIL